MLIEPNLHKLDVLFITNILLNLLRLMSSEYYNINHENITSKYNLDEFQCYDDNLHSIL